MKLVTAGSLATIVSKFALATDWPKAVTYGLATIAAIAILTAKEDSANAS